MKSLLIFLVLLFLTTQIQSQQQDKFIIGADWLNPNKPSPLYTFPNLSDAYWDTIQSFGLNYG